MEIKIVITKKNKDTVLKLIDELVEAEAISLSTEEKEAQFILSSPPEPAAVLRQGPKIEALHVGEPNITKSVFGTWGMFNSYIPGKAALRVLTHLVSNSGGKSIEYNRFMDKCIAVFRDVRLSRYRGFPKKASDSAKQRLSMHLIWPYSQIGLIQIYGEKDTQFVTITKEGLEFANLPNPLLDYGQEQQILSEEESRWLLDHLRKIDELGFKEFSTLKSLVTFLALGHKRFEDIVNWFKNNKEFVDWVNARSRYKDNPRAFYRQLHNISTTFASGKIALLRELGIISTSRAKYQVLGNRGLT